MDTLDSTRLRATLRYDQETGVFHRPTTGAIAGSLHSNGYVYIKVAGRRYAAHRLAWLYVHGVWPEDQLDHINRRRGDNRIANLREATGVTNAANRNPRADSKSGYLGVTWYARSGKWQATTRKGGKTRHLGYFDTVAAARAAYLGAV